MFWGTSRRIIDRAKSLGDLVLLTRDRMLSMPFDDLIAACHRTGLVDSYIDRDKQKYAFAETEPSKADFIFRVEHCERTLMVEGQHDYGRMLLTADQETVTFDVMPPLIPGFRYRFHFRPGRHAHRLTRELRKFPGFIDAEQMRRELRRELRQANRRGRPD
ncbi:MAG TPA: hypothetical protein VGR52_03020 [Stellaceae bacterium]|nr:hypothetical protein [Stellaceae bacterium]